ncbi:hypothetical protein ACFL6H_05685 [Candidatus Latescibacterota bacterium]
MEDMINITIKYTGDDVDNGTMAIDDMIVALQGFSGSYGKIVKHSNFESKHALRVMGIQKGSCELLISAQESLNQNDTPALGKFEGNGVYEILELLNSAVNLTKHIKKNEYNYNINSGENTISVTNKDGAEMDVPLRVFELYRSGVLADDINKIVSPIKEGKIDSGYIISPKHDGKELTTEIFYSEKSYFDVEKIEITKTEEIELTGILNSLTKTTNKGRFILSNGAQITYFLAMEQPEDYYPLFAHKGSVRVKCYAHLDESLTVIRIDIIDIEKIQLELF